MSISMKRTVSGSSSPVSSLKKSRTQIEDSELYLLYFYEDGPVGYAMYRLDLTASCADPIAVTPILELSSTHYPSSMGAFVVGSKIYLIGGEIQLSPDQIQLYHDGIDKPTSRLSDKVYVYDTAAAASGSTPPLPLSFGPPMNSGKTLPIIIPLNELIYVLSDLPTFHNYFDEDTALFEVFDPNANGGKGMWSALVNPPFYPTSRQNYGFEGMIVSHAVVNSTIFFCSSRKDRMYAFHLGYPKWEVFDLYNPDILRQFPFIYGALSISDSVWAATGSFSISPVCTYDFTAEYGFVMRDVEDFLTTISSDPYLAYDVHYQLLDLKNGWYCLLKYGFKDEDIRVSNP